MLTVSRKENWRNVHDVQEFANFVMFYRNVTKIKSKTGNPNFIDQSKFKVQLFLS